MAHSTSNRSNSGASFRLRRVALALLKVPPEPHPPAGNSASLQVFHAGRNYLRLRLAGWATTQFFALAGILFWTAMLIDVEHIARREQARQSNPAALTAPRESGETTDPEAPLVSEPQQRQKNFAERFADRINAFAKVAERAGKTNGRNGHLQGWTAYKQMLVEFALMLPEGGFGIVWGLKIFGFAIYLLQIPITYAVVRLDYEMRWYMVTDRSLRLRHGVWKVSESTMSFANIQNVLVTQGPVQRLLGLGDVKVQSAGGGGSEKNHHHRRGEDMHVGLFHSVTNAPEIRDLIAERLRRFRETGLGDPDERSAPAVHTTATASPDDALGAARGLLSEARALRAAATSARGQTG